MPRCAGRLRNANLTPEYRRGLREAARWLLDLAISLGAQLSSDSPQKVDRWLERCIEYAYDRGEKLYYVRLGLIGLQRAWHLSGPLLRGSWSAIRGWRALQPIRSRIPMSRSIMQGVVLTLLMMGNEENGYLREIMWAAMLSVWLSFEGLLRPGETEQLLVRDLCFPDQHGGGSEGLVVTIRKPKTRRLWHTQFVLIRDRALISWLRWWTMGVSTNRVLFRVARRRWAKVFGQSLAWLQLDDRGFTLGSLRAGGATWHFKNSREPCTASVLGQMVASRDAQALSA